MNVTVDHLIQIIHRELSSHRIERFTMTDLIRLSKVTRGTVYNYFESIDDLYIAAFQRLIMDKATEDSDSFEDFIYELVTNISENKTFSLNFYRLTKMMHKRGFLINNLNKQLLRFNMKQDNDRIYVVSGFCFILINWFDADLRNDKDTIIEELNYYSQMIKE